MQKQVSKACENSFSVMIFTVLLQIQGSITGVNSLSGYVYGANFTNTIIFSILANDSSDVPADEIRGAMDKIVVALAELSNNCK
jgi:predicted secreted protein